MIFLIEIDPSSTQPELQASLQQLALARSEIARLRSTVDGTRFAHGNATQRQLHASSNESLDRQLAAKDKEQESLKEQIEQERTKISQNNKLLAAAQERLTRYEQVSDILPKTDLEDARNQVVALASDIEQSNHKIGELNLSIDRVAHEKEQLRQSFKTDTLTDLVDRERAITDLSAKRDELAFKNKKQRLLAPVDGIVEELFIHTVGGVITPAEKVLSIMPDHTQLVIETEVSNDDIGFVSAKLPAYFKVDTFDFQKYGMMEGTVKLVSKDSHLDQEQKTANKFYRVLIKPTKSQLIVDGRKEMLTTGMTGTAEIRVGKRKIIEFFVYPLLRGLHNGMGVR